MVRTKSDSKVRSSTDIILSFALESRVASFIWTEVEMTDLIPEDGDLYMMAVVFHTVLLSVMTLTMHPVPAISVSWNRPQRSSAKISRRGDVMVETRNAPSRASPATRSRSHHPSRA